MRRPILFRLTFVLTTVIGLSTAYAQRADDPPFQVARLAQRDGVVTTRRGGEFPVWRATVLNQPVLPGDAVWAEPAGKLSLQIGDLDLQAMGGTEVDLIALDSDHVQMGVLHGAIMLHVPPTHTAPVQIRTPAGIMTTQAPGDYAIQDIDQPVRLFESAAGAASLMGDGYSATLGADQQIAVTGTDSLTAAASKLVPSAVLAAWLARPKPAKPPFVLPTSLAAIPGLDALAAAGSWRLDTDYNLLWYPKVAADWVPYRKGCWRWVRPWGWDWIAEENWGFAPFHYGRWEHRDDGWAWRPPVKTTEKPFAYEPALVAFFPDGADRMGWLPLAPGEAYFPAADTSKDYVALVNAGIALPKKHPVSAYANRAFASQITRKDLAATGCTGADAALAAPEDALAIVGRAPVQPTIDVFGLPKPPLPGPIPIPAAHRERAGIKLR